MTLPLIMPGVVGAALLAFALSIDDFVITNFNSGSTVTFPSTSTARRAGDSRRDVRDRDDAVPGHGGRDVAHGPAAAARERLASVRPPQESA